MRNSSSTPKKFSLSAGGLLYLAQRWIRGPESPDFPIPTQILITVALLWLPIVLLSLFEGTFSGTDVAEPLISDIVPHVRLLIAIPLLLVADLAIDPAAHLAVRDLETSGVVQRAELPRFQAALKKMRDARDAMWPDIVIVLLAFGFIWLFKSGYGDAAVKAAATSWAWTVKDGAVGYTVAGWWYLLVSGPMFQVILFRWFWRYAIWTRMLFRLSRLPLTLQPTHADLAGGIGYLGVAQQSFVTVFLAFATVASSTIAHDLLSGGNAVRDTRLEIIVLVIGLVAIIYAPLFFFSRQLFVARRSGLKAYGSLGYKLSEAFHDKWALQNEEAIGKDLLGSTDPSAMADYSATYDNVRSMRLIPATLKGVLLVAGILLAPFLPLALIEFSIQDLLRLLADALV
jgi:hypothetical protein